MKRKDNMKELLQNGCEVILRCGETRTYVDNFSAFYDNDGDKASLLKFYHNDLKYYHGAKELDVVVIKDTSGNVVWTEQLFTNYHNAIQYVLKGHKASFQGVIIGMQNGMLMEYRHGRFAPMITTEEMLLQSKWLVLNKGESDVEIYMPL
jgi:hypothetical protein